MRGPSLLQDVGPQGRGESLGPASRPVTSAPGRPFLSIRKPRVSSRGWAPLPASGIPEQVSWLPRARVPGKPASQPLANLRWLRGLSW